MIKKTSIKELFYNKILHNPNKEIIVSEKSRILFSDLNLNILKCITYLKKNYKKKNIIFINSNTEDFFIFFLACLFANYKIFPLDPNTNKKKINSLKKKFKFDYVVDNFNLKKIVNEKKNQVNLTDHDFLYILSSGTGTGEPSAILHTSKSLLSSSKSFSDLAKYNESTVIYHCLPTFYMAGILNTFLSCIFSQSKIAIGKTFSFENIGTFWEDAKKLNVNSLHLTPSIYFFLCITHRVNQGLRDHLANYQSIISTASYLYPEIRKKFFKTFKRRIQSCYGLTELGGPLTCENIDEAIFDDNDFVVGEHSKELKIKITKKQEILINSPFLMKGYVTENGKIEKPKLKNGYFVTGDLGSYKNGNLSYFGRKKEIIKVGGELISLTIVENLVYKSNFVSDCAAVGKPSLISGEELILFIVFKKRKNINSEIIKLSRYLKKTLRKIELPKKIIPISEMPKTKSGKIIKKKLIDLYTLKNV
ncbi:acyl--CoA ligase [Candidatus Pelagibacter sp.]|nr:acyl--CoA ligase [Candidatus Pelagibacter sp.]